MPEPTMHMPRKWRESNVGWRYFNRGWDDAVQGLPNSYKGAMAAMMLVIDHGQVALQAYEDAR